jgi:hypothetical protein
VYITTYTVVVTRDGLLAYEVEHIFWLLPGAATMYLLFLSSELSIKQSFPFDPPRSLSIQRGCRVSSPGNFCPS